VSRIGFDALSGFLAVETNYGRPTKARQ